MRRIAFAILVVLLTAIIHAGPASAGIAWCAVDPVVVLGGTNVQILTAIPVTYQRLVTGPIEVEVVTPPSVERAVLSTDDGFNGNGEQVTFTDGDPGADYGDSFAAVVRVTIPTLTHHPIPVRVAVITVNDQHVEEGDQSGIEVSTVLSKLHGAHSGGGDAAPDTSGAAGDANQAAGDQTPDATGAEGDAAASTDAASADAAASTEDASA